MKANFLLAFMVISWKQTETALLKERKVQDPSFSPNVEILHKP